MCRQLGDGGTHNTQTPLRVPLPHVPIKAISCGDNHSFALTQDGEVLAWGANAHGQLGDGSSLNKLTATKIRWQPASGKIKAISGGEAHSAAVTEQGRVYTWGNPDHGRLGLMRARQGTGGAGARRVVPHFHQASEESRASSESRSFWEPQEVEFLRHESVVDVSCGDCHTATVNAEGFLHTWGHGLRGQLGCGNTRDAHVV